MGHSLASPNAALLIDFDNVTMGIRSDLQSELKTLLSSDIIQGKVQLRRAYADWRRYPQYVTPLAESSIDMIMAPAYGSSKKNATDIRLAIDALELVFTRPEIGTYILLSGDSDFSTLVIKLKEYGKYVIGVGMRESSSDLLVMNCDEYYSYNALAGLVRAGSEEDQAASAEHHNPWELVTLALERMQRNGDVMRADRLKQVMQDIDSTFDEKDSGKSKFSLFVQEAARRGLVSVTKMENGQLEVGPPSEKGEKTKEKGEEIGVASGPPEVEKGANVGAAVRPPETRVEVPPPQEPVGERLRRDEALALIRQATESLAKGHNAVSATAVRNKARDLLGRDSETLSERHFLRILRDAHDADLIDLRRRGDDYEVALPVPVSPVAEQLNLAVAAHAPAPASAATAAGSNAAPPRGMRPRGAGGRTFGARKEPPADLLSIGVVDTAPAAAASATQAVAASIDAAESTEDAPTAQAKRGRRKRPAGKSTSADSASASTPATKTRGPRSTRSKKASSTAE